MKCWMLCEPDGKDCRPVWAEDLDAARAATKDWDVVTDHWEAKRIPAWNNCDPGRITDLDWYMLEEGYGKPCDVCGEIVYAEVCPVWWTIDGKPLHGPSWDTDDCYLQVTGMPQNVFILLEFERNERIRISAGWRSEYAAKLQGLPA